MYNKSIKNIVDYSLTTIYHYYHNYFDTKAVITQNEKKPPNASHIRSLFLIKLNEASYIWKI